MEVFGGDQDGCIFALYPKCVQDTLVMINDAKSFLSESKSKWAEMTMISRNGQKEIVKLYQAQDEVESVAQAVEQADFQDTIILDNEPNLDTVDNDPYSWSAYN